MDIDRFIDDLEDRLEREVEEDLITKWTQFCRGQYRGDVFVPRRMRPGKPPRLQWPAIRVNETLHDIDKMVLSQLAPVSASIVAGDGRMLNVRSNYGVPILAMPFGCELFVMAEQSNTLPNCHPLGEQKARAWADKGMPSVDHPYLQPVYEVGRQFMQIRSRYPKIGKYVAVYHPDLQGPMDILELIWGSEIFTALVDEPEFMHRMLRLITDFYSAVMTKWNAIVPPFRPDVSCHWGLLQPGQIMIREDSAMNLSPEMFREFMMPYDSELLAKFGGGAIHACGRLDHWTQFLSSMPGTKALQMSQPHLNDLDRVLRETIDRGILLLDLNAEAVRKLQSAGRPLHGKVQAFM
jgi:hypothetical protein